MADACNLNVVDSHGRFRFPTDDEVAAANLTPDRAQRWQELKQSALDVLDSESLLKEAQHQVDEAQNRLKLSRARLGSLRPHRTRLDEVRASIATQKMNLR